MEGKGVMTWEDKTKFQGDFVNNNRSKGKFILQNGETYDES